MSQHLPSERFDENARQALADDQLRGALRYVTDQFAARRRESVETLDGWQELREQGRAIKDATLRDLDRYLGDFAARATEAGAVLHWAADAAEARALILGICADAGARRVVKAKSMTTEEIHLNAALEAAGLDVLETDLGEWIIQLADEVPSHIIVPAIHKNRRQIADLLVAETGMEWTDDPQKLTDAARQWLRARFAAADVGISGVNFAIAETGSILMVENEGNIRFTTSLPRVHVAVMGIEKVIPRFADLEVFLRLLPRAGTGQQLTSYQSLITGSRGAEQDGGPGVLHIVVLDNGRSAMLAADVTRQSLACIRCGACLNVCPVYQQIGGHAYGSVYPGPIGAVITPQLAGFEKTRQLPYASSLCGACRDVCPVKIDIPELLLHLRGEITQQRPRFWEGLAFRTWGWWMRGRRRYELAMWLGRRLQRLVLRGGRASRLAPPLAVWMRGRDLDGLAPRSFRQQWAARRGGRGR